MSIESFKTRMNAEIISLLQKPANELTAWMPSRHYVRLFRILNNHGVTTLIGVYRLQEQNGGYNPRRQVGFLKFQNVGRMTLQSLNKALSSIGLPKLNDAPLIIEEFDSQIGEWHLEYMDGELFSQKQAEPIKASTLEEARALAQLRWRALNAQASFEARREPANPRLTCWYKL